MAGRRKRRERLAAAGLGPAPQPKRRDTWTPKPASGIPAGGPRAQFQRGNTHRLEHGARSAAVYQPLAAELAAGLLAERPDLARYPGEVAAWAEWEARAVLLRRHLAKHGDLDGIGADAEVRESPTRWLAMCETRAAKHRDALGLTPLSEARLAKERASAAMVTVDLQAIAERGRAALEQRTSDDSTAASTPAALTTPDLAGDVLSQVAEEGRRAHVEANERARQSTEPEEVEHQ